jgi:DNA-binding transcriptional LysR family regulator
MEVLWARAYLPLGGVKLNYTLTGCQAERQRISQATPRLASVNYHVLLFALLAGKGLQFCPQWSVAPYLRRGELVQVLPDLIPEPDQFGSKVHVIYPVHSAYTQAPGFHRVPQPLLGRGGASLTVNCGGLCRYK